MAKYAMIYFPLTAVLAALVLPSARIAWRDALVAAVIALLIVSPNLVWNAANQFATLQHTADNADWQGPRLDLAGLAGFLAGQFAVAGPVFFAAYLAGLARWRDGTTRYLAIMSLPILAIVSVQALVSGANANWAASAHLAALVLATAVLAPRPRLLAAGLAINLAITAALPVAAVFADRWRIGSGNLVLARYVGQGDLSRHAGDIARTEGLDTLVSGNRAMLADFFYTLRDSGLAIHAEPTQGFPPHHYAQKHPLPPGPGDVLYITRSPTGPECLAPTTGARGRPLAAGAGLHHPRAPRLPRSAALLVPRRLMAVHVRHPGPIFSVPAQPGAWTFSVLFFLELVARASLVTVLPLTAYALLGGKEAVSLAYTAVSLAALGFTFAIPTLVRRLSRRWAYTLGAALLGLYAILLALDVPPALILGMFCRTAGAALLNVTLSLYIMDNIGKRDLVRSEPLRLAVATLAWGLAPLLGVRLMQSIGLWAPSALSLAAVVLLLAVFWALRLAEGGPIRPAAAATPAPVEHPVAAIRRFAAQPRLRLAWAIAFARSAFWTTFFIYVPILMLEGGLGATAGGVAVAAGNLMLLNNLWARGWAQRHSLRRVLGVTFLAAAALTLAAGLLSLRLPAAAGAAMVAAAFFVAIIDGLGPVPFLRAVRTRERATMTAVYRTYLDASELLPPLAYVFLFMLGGFAAAFAGLAVLLALIGLLTLRHLPRGM